ncbi:hypothetical protein JZO70_13325 [Enterococcus sp. 669A]|uniref:Uncharacterized protein n=1 Tax=Candidatus Enterococcus moelleringii TaxID=2815325 RepID=A0ABS3LBZ2_9ENTE|nr:hypothetical protein [Enterococcus sp. 669A]MBO1307152.1 hypothetical protein [Enterococcus sp. 669A]
MHEKTWKVTNAQMFFQIGDTLNEVMIEPDFFEKKLKHCCIKSPLIFNKDEENHYYFSESLELRIEAEAKCYSSVGDICYFPDWQCLGINLEDEDCTLCIPRYKIGKIKGNFCQIQSLTPEEEGHLYWQYTLEPPDRKN